MNISVDTLLVVALMMAVFAAVTTLGTSLILGVGFERLRNGLEILKKQSGFFSDAIHKLDTRADTLEKQGTFFFQTLAWSREENRRAAGNRAGADRRAAG